uniref:hypothetical protein n=1 Tax=Microvirga sesbaniae TaxID=681392 RepID=UPI0021C8CE88
MDHSKDPGGATNLDVTIGGLSANLGRPATNAEVKTLTLLAFFAARADFLKRIFASRP